MKVIHKLYLNRLLSSWGDRTWEFCIGLYLIKLYPESLLLAAVQGILASSATILFAPMIGRCIETASRLKEVKICLCIQNGCVVICSLLVSVYFIKDDIENESIRKVIQTITPILLVIFSIIAQVCSIGYTLVLEKDWLVALADSEKQLTKFNAMLRRIDLTCQTIAPFMAGFLIQYSEFGSAIFLTNWNFISGFIEYLILKSIYNMNILSLHAEKISLKESDLQIVDLDALKLYKHSFRLPGLSFALLYLTVLGFDACTVGFITSQDIEEGYIGIISLFAGISGIMGTIFYQWSIDKYGLKRTGLYSYCIQLISLLPCIVISFLHNYKVGYKWLNIDYGLWLFLIGIILSRAGLWSIDLTINQLIQCNTINPPVIGGVQTSLNIIMELMKFTFVAFIPSLDKFWILILISFISVLMATILFAMYVYSSSKEVEEEENKEDQKVLEDDEIVFDICLNINNLNNNRYIMITDDNNDNYQHTHEHCLQSNRKSIKYKNNSNINYKNTIKIDNNHINHNKEEPENNIKKRQDYNDHHSHHHQQSEKEQLNGIVRKRRKSFKKNNSIIKKSQETDRKS